MITKEELVESIADWLDGQSQLNSFDAPWVDTDDKSYCVIDGHIDLYKLAEDILRRLS